MRSLQVIAGLMIALMLPVGESRAQTVVSDLAALARSLARPSSIQWEGVAAASARGDLTNALERPIRLAESASQQYSQIRLHLVGRRLNGFQALGAFCRMTGLDWTPIEGAIVLTKPDRTPAVWRSVGRAWRTRLLREHPEWSRAHVGKPAADLDLVDVTSMAAAARLAGAYDVNVSLSTEVATSQTLVSITGRSMAVGEALSELSRQLDTQVLEQDGIFWIGTAERKDHPVEPLEAPREVRQSTSRLWQSVRTDVFTAEGWPEEISAVREWMAARGSPAGRNAGDSAEADKR
jgi:hypothetical protein